MPKDFTRRRPTRDPGYDPSFREDMIEGYLDAGGISEAPVGGAVSGTLNLYDHDEFGVWGPTGKTQLIVNRDPTINRPGNAYAIAVWTGDDYLILNTGPTGQISN